MFKILCNIFKKSTIESINIDPKFYQNILGEKNTHWGRETIAYLPIRSLKKTFKEK